jgi:hypothetical protein
MRADMGPCGDENEVGLSNHWIKRGGQHTSHKQRDYAILKLPDQDILDIVHKRVAGSATTDASAALLEIDEALEVLEEYDIKEIQQQQESIHADQFQRKHFVKEYSDKVRALRAEADGKNNKKKNP